MIDRDPMISASSEISTVIPAKLDTGIETPKKSSGFLSVIRGIGGAAASMIPGVGGMLGGIIGGGGQNFGNYDLMLQKSQQSSLQMLTLQQKSSDQSQQFTTVSNLLKSRHDSEMSAVSNIK